MDHDGYLIKCIKNTCIYEFYIHVCAAASTSFSLLQLSANHKRNTFVKFIVLTSDKMILCSVPPIDIRTISYSAMHKVMMQM